MSTFVVDANAVVSAALNPDGTARRALAAARAKGVIVLSDVVFRKIADVLARPKFARILTHDRRRETLELLSAAALWVEPQTVIEDCRDPMDNRYLELALAARATVIVSGDADLLVLDPWRTIRILRPAEFFRETEVGLS